MVKGAEQEVEATARPCEATISLLEFCKTNKGAGIR
jgi:hypothetical protein